LQQQVRVYVTKLRYGLCLLISVQKVYPALFTQIHTHTHTHTRARAPYILPAGWETEFQVHYKFQVMLRYFMNTFQFLAV